MSKKYEYEGTMLESYKKGRLVIQSSVTLGQLTSAVKFSRLITRKFPSLPVAYRDSLQLLIDRRFKLIKRNMLYGTKTSPGPKV
jgi:hypothetical protein